ncbi:glutathione S-transferase family protein [Sedimenticola selenatireducens]|uniref:glutathione S-transferase family protein n=1 Tax=Sedimenticola selenatireducens TaxID=191960 RepID=UPI00048FBD0A|nr:glutathione S-transferase family protein [Sedimenticola selenatireducens]
MLINGQWARDFHPVQGTDDEGGFVREQSQFRNWITIDGDPGPTGEGGFVAEPDRYHLYVALICPWASRTLMARKLKGLEDVISVTVLDPRLTEKVWRFGGDDDTLPGSKPDPLHGAEFLYELYLRAKSDYTGQITVPVLWDKHKETIVNNESSDIIRMFNDGFGNLASESIDLYPIDLRPEIDDVNDRLYDNFNNGVYRAGFATTQIAYERAVQEVFDSLDWIDQRLDIQNYLVGDRLTEADVRAFVTLIRFDLAYHGLFKTNLRQLRDYRNITAYMKHIYELPGIAETVSPEHIKIGYYSIRALNPWGIVPVGPTKLW